MSEIEELSQNIQRLLAILSQICGDNELLKRENLYLKDENDALKYELMALNMGKNTLKPIVVDLNEDKKPFESANVMCVQNEMQINARIRPFDAPEKDPAVPKSGGGKKTSL